MIASFLVQSAAMALLGMGHGALQVHAPPSRFRCGWVCPTSGLRIGVGPSMEACELTKGEEGLDRVMRPGSCLMTHLDPRMYLRSQLSKAYEFTEWREDLKRVMRHAGADEKPTVFLFSDTQIKQEAFLVDINNLLNSGEVRLFLVWLRLGGGGGVRSGASDA